MLLSLLFFISTHAFAHPQNCERVSEIVCGLSSEYDRGPCREVAPHVTRSIREVCRQFPPILRKLLLSLDRIGVGPKQSGIARAGTKFVYIGDSVFQPGANLSDLLTWKEQLNFGGSHVPGKVSFAFPRIEAGIAGWKHELLSYVLAHELGHVWSEDAIAEDFVMNKKGDFVAAPGSWCALSWVREDDERGDVPRSDQKFRGFDNFIFYRDGKTPRRVSERELLRTYRGLYASSFLTSYATQNHDEDIAESFAFTVLERSRPMQYRVFLPDGKSWSMAEKLASPQFSGKKSRILSLLGMGH